MLFELGGVGNLLKTGFADVGDGKLAALVRFLGEIYDQSWFLLNIGWEIMKYES